ncbi:MAG: hypothetical protein EDX89_05915 [Acidobacteria bacterium]|nr:MAG: hypothetical protein EDX89_05915 [Acidobacteriota bacterium]MCE7957069.1 hypothetical protein [Acidobacteria bacterium ACB2]
MGLFGGDVRDEIADRIAKRDFDKAVKLLRREVDREPSNLSLKIQLGDTYALAGSSREAVAIFDQLASELAEGGFVAKAIALLKKIQRIQPGRHEIEDRLADLVRQRDAESQFRSALRAPRPLSSYDAGTAPFPKAKPAVSSALYEPTPIGPAEEAKAEAAPPVETERTIPLGEERKFVLTPLFGEFSKEEFLAVMRGMKLLAHEPGDIIVAEGETGGSLFILTTGRVKAFVKDPAGKPVKVRELGEGDFFGEIAVLTGKPRTATVTAAAHCELLELDKPTLDAITEIRPHVRDVLQDFFKLRAGSAAETAAREGKA